MNIYKNINSFDITIFLRHFSTLITAGIPLLQCYELLIKSQEKPAMRTLIETIKRDLLNGKNLFYAFKRHVHYFGDITCRIVEIGEHTGKLDTLLITIADYHEKKQASERKIKQALFYPCIVFIISIIVTLGMLLFVIPRFAELFKNMQTELPAITRSIFYLANALQHHLWMLVTALICLTTLLLLRPQNSWQFSAYLPFLKQHHRKITLARFARLLALTMASGVPITHALPLAANACNNHPFKETIKHVTRKINAGIPMHQAIAPFTTFPVFMTHMIKIGEESGMLEEMLAKFADFTEADLQQTIQRLHQLLEPLIMIVLGVLIGGLVIGMYLPIFKLGSVL